MSRAGILSLLLALFCLVAVVRGKAIYDFRSSYVTQLTNFNFKDQVTKIRQNTNYVAVVQFYKHGGSDQAMQTANPWDSPRSLMSGCASITASSASAPSTVTTTPASARRRA